MINHRPQTHPFPQQNAIFGFVVGPSHQHQRVIKKFPSYQHRIVNHHDTCTARSTTHQYHKLTFMSNTHWYGSKIKRIMAFPWMAMGAPRSPFAFFLLHLSTILSLQSLQILQGVCSLIGHGGPIEILALCHVTPHTPQPGSPHKTIK